MKIFEINLYRSKERVYNRFIKIFIRYHFFFNIGFEKLFENTNYILFQIKDENRTLFQFHNRK